jgi:hypothetical protein
MAEGFTPVNFRNLDSQESLKMSVKSTSGTVLIRESTLLPAGLALESEAFLPGWRILRDIDVYGLGQKIEKAHWNFFYLAGEMKAIVFGRERPGALRRAVKQILAKPEGRKCNSLEITSVASKSFLGIPFLSVAANSRHIQESLYLTPGRETAARMPVVARPRSEMETKERQHHAEVQTREHPAQVSSSKSSSEI